MKAPLKGRKNKLSLLAGKLSLENKVCTFQWCLVFEAKIYYPLAGKILHFATDLSLQKSKYILHFWLDSVQKCGIFLFLATLHSQKTVKAHVSSSYQAPFKSAIYFFNSFVKQKDKRELRRTIVVKYFIVLYHYCF